MAGLSDVFEATALERIAGLRRTSERIAVGDATGNVAAGMSFKLLLLMFLAPALLFVANALILFGAAISHRSLHHPQMFMFSTAMCAISVACSSYLIILRARVNPSAAGLQELQVSAAKAPTC
jgi:hypothetical protein